MMRCLFVSASGLTKMSSTPAKSNRKIQQGPGLMPHRLVNLVILRAKPESHRHRKIRKSDVDITACTRRSKHFIRDKIKA